MRRLFGLGSITLFALACGTSDGGAQAPSTTPATDKADAGSAADAGPLADAGPPPLAEGLTIREVAVFQAVKIGVAKDGARIDERSAPVIANRPGLLRAYVDVDATWTGHAVVAELHLWDGETEAPVQRVKKTVKRSSIERELETTFNFSLDAETIPAGVTYSIVIRDPMGTPRPDADSPARYPTDGTVEDLGASASSPQVRIKLVPVAYKFDGSGRTPDTSDEQIEQYRSTLFKMYPTAKIDITVRKPFPWTSEILPDGTGWDSVLEGIVDLRQKDKAEDDVFYVGVFDPETSLRGYCSGGCVLGVAPLATVSDVEIRVAAVVGYGGVAENTLLQELAHAMGREHAPCGGADGPDKKYPYKGARIGTWGYDIAEKTLLDPEGESRDIMGYCEPLWISDYTYNGLYDRIKAINLPKRVLAGPGEPKSYRFVRVGADGELRWGRPVMLRTAPRGEELAVTYRATNGQLVSSGTGHYFPYDTIPGGFMLVADGPATAASLDVRGLRGHDGVLRLAR